MAFQIRFCKNVCGNGRKFPKNCSKSQLILCPIVSGPSLSPKKATSNNFLPCAASTVNICCFKFEEIWCNSKKVINKKLCTRTYLSPCRFVCTIKPPCSVFTKYTLQRCIVWIRATRQGSLLRYVTQKIGIDFFARVLPYTKHSTIDLYAAML